MIRDDQDVTEEWILRVDGREYGPANIDTLREWKAEGRVLPANEARRADAELWTLAGGIPGLFDGEPLATAVTPRQSPTTVTWISGKVRNGRTISDRNAAPTRKV